MTPEGQKLSESIHFSPLLLLGAIYLLSLLALTPKQRKAILERDGYRSQMRHYSEEKGWHTIDNGGPLQVHHIDLQRNGGGDEPYNLITLSEEEHIGKRPDGTLVDPSEQFVVHPDVIGANKKYRKGNKNAFKEMVAERNEKIKKKRLYHNPEHDEEMLETARERTNNAIARGWRFPYKK